MIKINNLLKKFVQLFFILLIGLMIFFNFIKFYEVQTFFKALVFISIFVVILYVLYKLKLINNRNSIWLFLVMVILGSIIRAYFVNGLNFKLESDFAFYYSNAKGILGNTGINSSYLSYNGYAYIFASIISALIYLFGDSAKVVLYFNLICQIITVIYFYKLVKSKSNAVIALALSSVWYFLPNNMIATLLVSTETLFMMLFIICLYYFYTKIIKIEALNKNNIISLILFGLLLSFTNNIRPVMAIFMIALIINGIFLINKKNHYISLGIIIIIYFIGNTLLNVYVENGIEMKTQSGALEWSIYFGANKNNCGAWCLEDSIEVSEIINEKDGSKNLIRSSIDRYKNMTYKEFIGLMGCKYSSLWTDNYSMYYFVTSILVSDSKINFEAYHDIIKNISLVFIFLLMTLAIASSIYELKNNKYNMFFFQVFAIGYVLSNLIVVLNGRYNYLLYPLLILITIPIFNYYLITKREKKYIVNNIITPKDAKVLLIIPAYNEEKNIISTINKIKKSKNKYDYIIINDGSTDDTDKICKKNNYSHISLVDNLGIGGAVQTGYKYALENNYDVAIQFDGDGQHDVNYVKDIIKPLTEGYDLVVGSRFIDNHTSEFKSTAARRVGIKIISLVIKFLTEHDIKDPTSGFRAINKNLIPIFASSYPTEFPEPISFVEITKKGYTFKEVPVKMHERKSGVSSIYSWKKAYYMVNVTISMLVVSLRRNK